MCIWLEVAVVAAMSGRWPRKPITSGQRLVPNFPLFSPSSLFSKLSHLTSPFLGFLPFALCFRLHPELVSIPVQLIHTSKPPKNHQITQHSQLKVAGQLLRRFTPDYLPILSC
jgi:hypothetical protein